MRNWYAAVPSDFLFALKAPQAITHEKCLVGCDEDIKGFLQIAGALQEKLGAVLLQFPYFNKKAFAKGDEFVARLQPFLSKLRRAVRGSRSSCAIRRGSRPHFATYYASAISHWRSSTTPGCRVQYSFWRVAIR